MLSAERMLFKSLNLGYKNFVFKLPDVVYDKYLNVYLLIISSNNAYF